MVDLSVSDFTFPGRYPKINKDVTCLKGTTHQTHTPHAEIVTMFTFVSSPVVCQPGDEF